MALGFECFEGMFERIMEELKADDVPQSALDWVKEMITYTVPGGKRARGLAVVATATRLLNGSISDEQRQKEWLQASFLVADDVMDQSITRRGKPCWFRKKDVGLTAINDSLILESLLYKLLKMYFKKEPYYVHLLELFHSVTLKTEIGQLLDLATEAEGRKMRQQADAGEDVQGTRVNFTLFTRQYYSKMVRHKTGFYTFYLPVALGMVMAGVDNDAAFEEVREVCLMLGEYFQIQDDYLDCYGDPTVIGKVGTDIMDTKCSWLLVTALEMGSPEQIDTLELHYGRDSESDIQKVKDVYAALDMPARYAALEESFHKEISEAIGGLKHLKPEMPEIFTNLLSKMHKRQK